MTKSGWSIGARVARGAAWMVSLRVVDRLLGMLSTLVLARLLFPEDFGLVALAMAFASTLVVFSEFSFDLALIQNQAAERRHYDTAWTFGVLRGAAICLILLIIAKPAAGWFDDSRLTELIIVFALLSLGSSFANVGIVEFRKQLEFHRLFILSFSTRLAGVITSLTLAYLWRDYWALVAGIFTTRFLHLCLSYVLHPYRPRFSLAGWHDIFNYSKWIFVNSIVSIGGNRLAVFVIGAILAPASIGIYSMSYEIANVISNALVAPAKRVLFPGYAKIAHDLEGLKRVFLDSYGLIVLVATPAAIGIGMTADLAVPIVLGERWLDTIPIIQILVGAALTQALTQIRPLFLALNKPDTLAYLSLFHTVLIVPALLAGTWAFGLVGAALATVGIRFVLLIIQFNFMSRALNVSYLEFWQQVWRSLTACTLLALSVYFAKERIVFQVDANLGLQFLHLTIVVAIGIFTYILGVLLLWFLSGRPASSAESIILTGAQRISSKMKARFL